MFERTQSRLVLKFGAHIAYMQSTQTVRSYSPELKFVWIMSNENVINQLGTFMIDAFHMRNHLMQS